MAGNTSKTYRNQVMYSVFVRNYSPEGTFESVRRDLRRIKDLGADIVWLMPIHPISTCSGHISGVRFRWSGTPRRSTSRRSSIPRTS